MTQARAGYQLPEVIAARNARDRGSVEELQKAIVKLKAEADQKKNLAVYLQLALFNVWLCEAAEDNQNDAVSKDAAEAGVAAAEKAVAIDPRSSDAHQLLGDLLSQLIPHVYGGGMKYGKRATDEMDRALELDPRNVDAYVSRALSFYYTPASFGGSKTRAIEMLKKAVEINSAEDSPHIWLATFYLEDGKQADALREINQARSTNPDRAFTKFVYGMVTSSKKSN
jgi:tetratricopeptide (TPR) repeat protein